MSKMSTTHRQNSHESQDDEIKKPLESAKRDKAVLRKLDLHLLPVIYGLAILLALDATNIGIARIEGLEEELRMQDKDFNIAALVFFIPCILFDVPANILFQASRPPLFFGTVVLLTGIVTVLEGITESYVGFVACRLLLGVCQTCFQAGAIYLVASYYPRYSLHSRISPLIACRLLSSAFGSLLGFGIAHLDGVAGLTAWRWIYVVEGLVTCAAAFFAFFLVPGWPERARFLDSDERRIHLKLLQKGSVEENRAAQNNWRVLKGVLHDPKVYFSALIHFGCVATSHSAAIFIPTILNELGWESSKAMYMAIPIFLFAAALTLALGFASDYTRQRYPFCVGPLLAVVAALTVMLASSQSSVKLRYAACFFLGSGAAAGLTISITWLSNNIVCRKTRGIAFGLAAMLGNCGSILGMTVYPKDESPRYPTGFGVCLAMIVVAIVAATAQWLYLVRRRKAAGEDCVL
ncbi:hypothetical protein LTR37_016271 [Vermiconidia calcicola]|uniref:Uncharacterized protein n=1 Tax=Vermiconidia calcicola TaxID=1690605 RepID=A0ACC3MPU3_9PEZI|nr:hypothetical protein LTR37_016271 [Vermiconidia calcicola]